MYQPISFPVIRQALQWHDIPCPELRQLSFCDQFEDHVIAEYLATWSFAPMQARFPDQMHDFTAPHIGAIKQQLQEAFCEDVTVIDLEYSPFRDVFTALLYVKVSRSMDQWAHWLDGEH